MRLNAGESSDSIITSWVKVLFNGSDITGICYEADNKGGWAGVYIATKVEQGKVPALVIADEDGLPISRIINGKVEFILKPDAPEAARLEFERRKAQEN